ncbi:uncharacterized protein LOC114468469 [Gouania willdenowi]|uniref:uncharacterized protein LOC114468469 n=1 Tax=Gouania willdenowi TaxID=441366 RepID=UPI001054A3FC|nr:uncharacterized protein LOC114468469 [Gouania willdenowi]XP_028311188.1 uncharacterized protein LOC114468469 [Gouania willdenowi]XP_028311189.1 uncharacterized protein LOC114468469 [Gouania willdenowi]
MAQPGRTVRVSGLPSDIQDVRLKDKLLIHFQRVSNGGGDIDSVNIVKGTPMSALITFQESRVAQRIIRHSQHVLVIDGRSYKLTATEHCECMDPNQVIIHLSATVDYRWLPGGSLFLTNLLENHRDVRINYIETEKCKLSGTYSKVQAALTQLLGHVGHSESAKDKLNVEKVSSESKGVKTAHKSRVQETEDQNRMVQKQKGEAKQDENNYSPGDSSSKDIGQAALMPKEDCSLIVDAVLFKYLQKHYSKECQKTLRQYNVSMLDVTNEGLTTLTLEPLTVARAFFKPGHLTLAKEAIRRFYQKHEAEIRQVKIPKTPLPSKGQLERAMESLCTRYPKLLVSEDDHYIDIIGSCSDVSEARMFLQNFDNTEIISKPEQASLPKHTSSHVERFPSSHIGDPLLKTLWTEEKQKIPHRPKKPKLAAQFKDLVAFGHRSADIGIGTNSSCSGQSRPGPMLGLNVLSKPAKVSDEPISRALPQSIASDILFKNSTTLPASVLNPELTDARPKSLTPVKLTSQFSFTGNADFQLVASKSTLRRSNSFSAIPQEKAVVMESKSLDNSSKTPVRSRARSSSFSSETNKEKHEITVPLSIWEYMNQVHRVQIDDLTSDVLMNERLSDDCKHKILTLRGANEDKVSFSQLCLQQLVDSLRYDISVNELYLSELGVSDSKDETLRACCSEMQSRFKKVCVKFTKHRMIITGPRNLCSQLCATLRDVFSGSLDQTDNQPKSTAPYNSMGNFPSSLEINRDRVPEYDSNKFSSKAEGSSKIQGWQTTYKSDFCEKEAANGFTSLPTVNKTSTVDSTPSFLGLTASGNDTEEGIKGDGLNNRAGDVKQIDSVGEHQAKTDN